MDLVLSMYLFSFGEFLALLSIATCSTYQIAILASRDFWTTGRVLVEYHIRKLSELQSVRIILKKAKYRIPHTAYRILAYNKLQESTSSKVTLLMFCKM